MLLLSDIFPVHFHLSFHRSFEFLCFHFLRFLRIFSALPSLPFVIQFCLYPYPLPVTVHILDILNNSLDFSAHNLTVNRKWVTWISTLLFEHRAQAAFVYTIILLKSFTLTNCLRSKEKNDEWNPIKWNAREGGVRVFHREHFFV